MLQIAKISSGLTVFAAAGFLVGAILTDNGGMSAPVDVTIAELGDEAQSKSSIRQVDMSGKIDRITTSSIKRVQKIRVQPLSVKNLITEENDEPRALQSITHLDAGLSKPVNGTIVVQPGDTLYRIGIKNNLSVSEIAALNNLSDPYRIRPGQTLIVK